MDKKTVCINGKDYNASMGIVMTLLYVADNHGGVLSDYLFSEVVQQFGADEDEVMKEMCDSNTPAFTRHSDGWDVISD